MSVEEKPLQVDEVVEAIRKKGACTIVHLPTRQEVDVYRDIYNKQEPWRTRKQFGEIPEKEVLHRALALGFQLCSQESQLRFGPRRGEAVTTYELHRNCLGDTAAAIKAIALVRLLPGVGAQDWLWVTSSEHDDREVPPPKPPANWPPRSS